MGGSGLMDILEVDWEQASIGISSPALPPQTAVVVVVVVAENG